jgi:hypothetical protein
MTPDDVRCAAGDTVPHCYICGPDGADEMAEDTLASHLGAGSTILTERFLSPDTPPPIQSEENHFRPARHRRSFASRSTAPNREVPLIAHQTLL